jgi:autotransporter-associated beta strand protein
MVRIYGDGNGDVLYAGGTIYTGSVTLNSVPSSAGSSTQTSSSDIDKTQPQYLASNLGSSVNPAFVGGTLKSDVASVTQNFTIDDSANGASSTIDQNGMDSNYSGVLSDAAGKTGSITVGNSGTGGSVTFSGSNTYTGTTTIDSNATLALSGNGSISSSSAVIDNGSLDISATNSGASINSLSGNGAVALGSKTLTLSHANDTFAGVIAGPAA